MLKNKFKVYIGLSLPASIVAILLLLPFGYGQTITSESNDQSETISFSELSTDATLADATIAGDATENIRYSPWGCKFTLRPFDVSCGAEKIVPPPPDIIKEQVEILNFLRGRKQRLDDKESLIIAREKELADLEKRIEQKINEVSQLNDNIEKARQEKAAADTESLKQLVSYYEKMPPENAALFFNQMDQQTATMILTRMNARRAAAVLASLDPKVAVIITEAVAKIKENREVYLQLPKYNEN